MRSKVLHMTCLTLYDFYFVPDASVLPGSVRFSSVH